MRAVGWQVVSSGSASSDVDDSDGGGVMAEVATTLRPLRLNVINTRHAARRRADARTRRSRPQTRAPVVAPSGGGVPSRSLPPPARAPLSIGQPHAGRRSIALVDQ